MSQVDAIDIARISVALCSLSHVPLDNVRFWDAGSSTSIHSTCAAVTQSTDDQDTRPLVGGLGKSTGKRTF